MKNRIFLIITATFLLSAFCFSNEAASDQINNTGTNPASIYCSQDIYPLASAWVREYNDLNPAKTFNLIMIDHSAAGDVPGRNLSVLSANDLASVDPGWRMSVGREVTVPVINASNPYITEIYERGISREALAQIIQHPEKQNWGPITGTEKGMPFRIYVLDDPSVKSSLANFLGIVQLPADGITLSNETELLSALQNDPYAVGICKLANLVEPQQLNMADNIRFLPIDKNGNGKMDYIENIYETAESFARGVWIGKYPKALSQDIFVAAPAMPENQAEIAFLNWILGDGQQLLSYSGFTNLVFSERQSKLSRINAVPVVVPTAKRNFPALEITLLILAAVILLSLIISTFTRRLKTREVMDRIGGSFGHQKAFDENSVQAPKGVFYDSTHTWAFMEKDGGVKVGIDDFLQHVTGPVSRVEMKKPGERIKKGDVLCSIMQQGKQLNIYSPVSGIIREQNPLLISNASLINTSPFADGWVYMIEPFDWMREMRFLSMADRYSRWLKDEFTRLKDFFTVALNNDKVQYAGIVLQDGGALKDNILSELGPEVWEDFQTGFLDKSK